MSKKSSNGRWPAFGRRRVGYGLILAALLSAGAPAWSDPPPKPKLPAAAETHWPGITVNIHQIARLPNNRVSVVFIYRALSKAPAETYIADRPLKSFATESEGVPAVPIEYAPYSIEKKGVLIDESTGKKFPAAEQKPGDLVNPGRTEALEMVRPDDGFFLGGVFECPPVNQDDPPKPQWISMNLPGLKNPIQGILLPREENVALDYYPKPRTIPLGQSAPLNPDAPEPAR